MTFLTGITHGRPDGERDRQRPPRVTVHETVEERVSLAAVVSAITDIMEDHNRFGVADRALAAGIAPDVRKAVAEAIGNGRISSSAQLTSQQAFWGILANHLASTSSSYTDQQAHRAFLHYVRTQANRTGADFANFVAQFRRGGGYADRADRDGSALLTSARFDGFSGADAVLLGRMRDIAVREGLHWAADRPEILRLGEDAIRLFARLGFSRQSHDRLHEAGFNHHDMHHIARYAERQGIDVNNLTTEIARSPGILGGGNAQTEQEWRTRLMRLITHPDDEAARRDVGRRLREIRLNGTPEQREHIERLEPLLRLEREATLELIRTTHIAETETAEAKAAREARERREREAREQREREAAERAAREAERAAAEAERRRVAALMGEDAPPDAPPPSVQAGPPATGQQQVEARPPPRLTATPT